MVEESEHKKTTFLDLMIVMLSIYVLSALLIESIFTLPPVTLRILYLLDDFICFVFLYDFFYRFVKSPSKLKFLKWGWIDLISSIPTLSYFRYGRFVRLFRLLRILRAFRSLKYLTAHVFRNRTRGTFALVTMVAVLMIIFGSISILQVENDPSSNIKTPEDAIWWAFVTITTVGYGDKFPVTSEGRIIAAFLMITGVGLFGTFTGFVASWFLEGQINNKKE